ncbi:MAG TPA: hypothetical protein VJ817_12105 [Gemmatimonadales bacterium]|nr:hypothetical protein [Gemmatimonadales bacterium]
MPPVMPPPLRPALRPLAISFIPEIAGATAAQWSELEERIAQALAARPAAVRRQLGLFVRVLEAASRIRYRAGLAALDSGRRTALLEAFAGSPLLLFRRGIWGLRTLVMLGWYTQPSVVSALGYRASPAGWEARR